MIPKCFELPQAFLMFFFLFMIFVQRVAKQEKNFV